MLRASWLSSFLAFLVILVVTVPALGQETPPAAEPAAEAPAAEAKPTETPAAEAKPAEAPATEAPAAETAPAETPAAPAISPEEADKAKAAYEAKVEEWRNVLKDLRKLKTQFSVAGPEERPVFDSQWNALIAKGNKIVPDLRTLGLAAYQASPNTDPQLSSFLAKLAADAAAADRYDEALQLSQAMIAGGTDVKESWLVAAVAAYASDNFAKSEEYLKKAKELGVLPAELNSNPQAESHSIADRAKEVEFSLPDYLKYWPEEEALRKAEAEKNDLPRVKLETTKGPIVVELFENEAPNTVANFVSLVESKFYDGLAFHRVLPTFMAQGGDPKGDGTGGPDYRIPCECYQENYRKHFEGTLSMAHAGKDTGGSQFFITFLPTPHLNGRHTAFGRIVEGMDVLANLQRRNPQDPPPLPEPDKIIKAEVLRKRDHAYEPKKVE